MINVFKRKEISIVPDFDTEYYLAKYPDVKDDPMEHYNLFGKKEGRYKNYKEELIDIEKKVKDFDEEFYLKRYPDIAKSDLAPIEHYYKFGKKEGRYKNYYNEEYFKHLKYKKIIEDNNFFDLKFYLETYPDVGLSDLLPLEEFITIGLLKNRNPNKDFDATWYNNYYKDVKQSTIYPVIHFLMYGLKEDRFQNESELRLYEIINNSNLFNEEFYKNSNDDLKNKDENFNFLLHYIRYGINEGGGQSKLFLKENRDIKKSILSPHEHYVLKDWKEESNTFSSYKFDMKKYVDIYQDVKKYNLNPISHYQNRGKKEGRHLFLSDEYLELINGTKSLTAFKYKNYKIRRNYVKNVIYIFNFNPEKRLSNPEVINEKYDYIYFGLPGSEGNTETIWEYRPSEFFIEDINLMFSFYCYNINILLPEYDNKVWAIDSEYLNKNNLNAIYSYMENDKADLFVFGQSDTQEASLLTSIFNDKDLMIDEFSSKYALKDINQYETIKPNCLILKQSSSDKHKILSVWWMANIKYDLDFFLPKNMVEYQSGYIINENSLTLKMLTSLEKTDYIDILKSFYKNLITQELDMNKYTNQFNNTKVSVIIPVFNALEDVKACLYAIETTSYSNYELLIADDCSAENVQDWLEGYVKGKKNIRLLSASKNRGYTRNVNNALQNTKADYKILLNSDTKVFGNWIEKLLIPFFEDITVGISGALSNAAGWQSVPYLRGDNTLPKHISVKDINKYLEVSSSHPYYPMSDIINGFCMCIKQETIDTIGFFDEKAFPRGYGEEDDFCIRARNHGFKNVIATTVYVHHSKSKSFGHSTRVKLATASRKVLDEKYGLDGYKLMTESIGKNPAINAKREKVQEFLKLYATKYSILNEKIAQIETVDMKYPKINPSIAVHIHLHYTDMAKYFSVYLKSIPYEFDLYLTFNENIEFELVEKHFKNNNNIKKIEHEIYDNRGRDVFPFIDTISKVYTKYEYVLHIHSKKSEHNPQLGSKWLNHLMSGLMYNKAYVKNLLYTMEMENIGLLFPPVIEELYPNYKWGKNKNMVKDLLENIGVNTSTFDEETLIFPAGNMFWAKTDALTKLFDNEFKIRDFPKEPIPIDGTLAHALERSLDFIVKDAGYATLLVEPKEKIKFKNELEMFKNRMLSYDDIEQTILKKLQLKEPFSLVRFYDGEGSFYKADNWSHNFLQERMKYYFGEDNYLISDALYIKDAIISSMKNADIVGIANLDIVEEMLEFTKVYADDNIDKLPFIRRRYNNSIDCHSAWRILSSFELAINMLTTDKAFCTKDIHYDMVLTGMIYRILDSVSEVSLITSQPVAEYIEKLFSIDVTHYAIPMRALDNSDFNKTKHYPDAFKEILTQLEETDIAGQLFLVGAGPLGKAYCNKIKREGGIALDMGAIFDSWVNFLSRPEHIGKGNSFDQRLLLTSENIKNLTDGKVVPKYEIDSKKLPMKKINKYLKNVTS